MAIEYGIKFMETSAKASINVEEAFLTLASDIKAKTEKRMVSVGVQNLNGKQRIFFYNNVNVCVCVLYRRLTTHPRAAIS